MELLDEGTRFSGMASIGFSCGTLEGRLSTNSDKTSSMSGEWLRDSWRVPDLENGCPVEERLLDSESSSISGEAV